MENTTNFDARTTMGELMYLIELNTNLCELYYSNFENMQKKSIFSFVSNLKTNMQIGEEQRQLILEMNKNVTEEWDPRMNLLKDNLPCFKQDMKLYNAFIQFRILRNEK